MPANVSNQHFDLKHLINAGADAPWAAGESFRNEVNGAEDGAGMVAYKCTQWAWDNGPVAETIYNDQHLFSMGCTFTQGAYAHHIRRSGAVLLIDPSNQPGFDAVLESQTVDADPTGTTANVRVTAPYSSAATAHGGAWFVGHNAPWEPGTDTQPGGNAAENIFFTGYLTNNIGSGSEEVVFTLDLQIDSGDFNGEFIENFTLEMNRRGEDAHDDWDWQWYSDSGYTNLVSSARVYTPGTTTPGASLGPYYLKARRKATGGAYGEIGAVSWTDPREEV